MDQRDAIITIGLVGRIYKGVRVEGGGGGGVHVRLRGGIGGAARIPSAGFGGKAHLKQNIL